MAAVRFNFDLESLIALRELYQNFTSSGLIDEALLAEGSPKAQEVITRIDTALKPLGIDQLSVETLGDFFTQFEAVAKANPGHAAILEMGKQFIVIMFEIRSSVKLFSLADLPGGFSDLDTASALVERLYPVVALHECQRNRRAIFHMALVEKQPLEAVKKCEECLVAATAVATHLSPLIEKIYHETRLLVEQSNPAVKQYMATQPQAYNVEATKALVGMRVEMVEKVVLNSVFSALEALKIQLSPVALISAVIESMPPEALTLPEFEKIILKIKEEIDLATALEVYDLYINKKGERCTAEDYFFRSALRFERKQLESALADCNRAFALQTRNGQPEPEHFGLRAAILLEQTKFEIKQAVVGLSNRGKAKLAKDPEGALKDFDNALNSPYDMVFTKRQMGAVHLLAAKANLNLAEAAINRSDRAAATAYFERYDARLGQAVRDGYEETNENYRRQMATELAPRLRERLEALAPRDEAQAAPAPRPAA